MHKRIHITGAHRSGTTLMWALMTTCFDIEVSPPEEVRLRAPLAVRGPIVCTKCPDESDYALKLLPLDPDLHVILMVRDPRDAIVSRYGSGPAPYFGTLLSWRRNRPPRRPHPRAHIVRYERLVKEPDDVQRQLMAAMPFLHAILPFSRFSDRVGDSASPQARYWSEAMHSIRPPSPESIGRWREHLARVKGQMIRHGDISRELIALGYEKDNSWLSLLDGIAPDLTPSHLREEEPAKAHVMRPWRNFLGMAGYLWMRHKERQAELRALATPLLARLPSGEAEESQAKRSGAGFFGWGESRHSKDACDASPLAPPGSRDEQPVENSQARRPPHGG